MRMQNKETGEVVEVPPPDRSGHSTVILNGRVVEHVTYSDLRGGNVTLPDGRTFSPQEWAAYIVEQLRSGAWRSQA